MPIRLLIVSAISRLEVPAAFWIEKAVVELALKRLLPVKVWLLALSKATVPAVEAAVPLLPVMAGMLTLGIQPASVQTVLLLMTRPELLAKVLPPLAARLPLAVKSPVSCKTFVAGSATSWPRVRVLPLARTVSRFRLSLASLAASMSLLLVWELGWWYRLVGPDAAGRLGQIRLRLGRSGLQSQGR